MNFSNRPALTWSINAGLTKYPFHGILSNDHISFLAFRINNDLIMTMDFVIRQNTIFQNKPSRTPTSTIIDPLIQNSRYSTRIQRVNLTVSDFTQRRLQCCHPSPFSFLITMTILLRILFRECMTTRRTPFRERPVRRGWFRSSRRHRWLPRRRQTQKLRQCLLLRGRKLIRIWIAAGGMHVHTDFDPFPIIINSKLNPTWECGEESSNFYLNKNIELLEMKKRRWRELRNLRHERRVRDKRRVLQARRNKQQEISGGSGFI